MGVRAGRHLEPSLEDPDTVYAGVEDAGLFRSADGGRSWQELPALRGHESGPSWQPGAGGMCLHTIILDPATPGRMFAAISAAGAFRSDDAGQTWRPVNHGRTGPNRGARQTARPSPISLPHSSGISRNSSISNQTYRKHAMQCNHRVTSQTTQEPADTTRLGW